VFGKHLLALVCLNILAVVPAAASVLYNCGEGGDGDDLSFNLMGDDPSMTWSWDSGSGGAVPQASASFCPAGSLAGCVPFDAGGWNYWSDPPAGTGDPTGAPEPSTLTLAGGALMLLASMLAIRRITFRA